MTTSLDDYEAGRIPVQLKSEENSMLPDADEELATETIGIPETQLPIAEEKRKAEDHEMNDGAYSPRKKRSRDQMDTEADREQKIAATEEARAQRRSDELDRSEFPSHGRLPQQGSAATNDALGGNKTNTANSEVCGQSCLLLYM